MDRRRGVFGEALDRVIGNATRGRVVASQALGREGWLRVEAELDAEGGWVQIGLDFRLEAELSRPGHEGLFLHPFTLTLGCDGRRVDEWSDALSRHWDTFPSECVPNHKRGQGAETFRVEGRLALLDVCVPRGAVLEAHLQLPWRDREKREGFEADSRLDLAVLRICRLSRAGRLLGAPGLERVIIG